MLRGSIGSPSSLYFVSQPHKLAVAVSNLLAHAVSWSTIPKRYDNWLTVQTCSISGKQYTPYPINIML